MLGCGAGGHCQWEFTVRNTSLPSLARSLLPVGAHSSGCVPAAQVPNSCPLSSYQGGCQALQVLGICEPHALEELVKNETISQPQGT